MTKLLISDTYREQLRLMRAENHRPRWGNGGQRHAQAVLALVQVFQPTSILDYGCGHGMLLAELAKVLPPGVDLRGYDPGMPQFSAEPAQADLLVSTDVLEHIEPACLDNVLEHMRALAPRAYLNIHTGPAVAKLPDGRNAHLIQEGHGWWEQKLLQSFSKVERVPGFGDSRPSFFCE